MPSVADTPWLIPKSPIDEFDSGLKWGDSLYTNKLRTRQQDLSEEEYRTTLPMKQQELAIRQADEARKAQEAAIRYQGYQDYLDDVKAAASDTPDGKETPEMHQAALLKHGPKMFYNTTAQTGIVGGEESRALKERLAQEMNALKERMTGENNLLKTELEDTRAKRVLDAIKAKGENAATVQKMKGDQALDAIDAKALWGAYDHKAPSGRGVVSEGEFINRHLNTVMKQYGVDESTAMGRLRDAYRKNTGDVSAPKEEKDPEVEAIDGELQKLKLDLIKKPQKALFDFGTDNRELQIQNLEAKKKTLLDKKAGTVKPVLKWNATAGKLE